MGIGFKDTYTTVAVCMDLPLPSPYLTMTLGLEEKYCESELEKVA